MFNSKQTFRNQNSNINTDSAVLSYFTSVDILTVCFSKFIVPSSPQPSKKFSQSLSWFCPFKFCRIKDVPLRFKVVIMRCRKEFLFMIKLKFSYN